MKIKSEADILNQAEHYKMLFESDLYQQAIQDTKHALFDSWISTNDTDTEKRERLWWIIQSIAAIEATMTSTVSTAEVIETNRARDLEDE